MIHLILKDIWICWNMSKLVQIQYDTNYELLQFIRFSNMSEHVQTCQNLFRFNMIWIVTTLMILKHVWISLNVSKIVQIQHDINCYDLYDSQTCLNMFKQTCLNLFRLNMIWIAMIHAIFKHVWPCWNMSKLAQIQYDMNWCDS